MARLRLALSSIRSAGLRLARRVTGADSPAALQKLTQTVGALAADQGIPAALALADAKAGKSGRARATLLTEIVRSATGASPAERVRLARQAFEADPRPFRAKWAAFVLFDNGEAVEAARLLGTLDRDYIAGFQESEHRKYARIMAVAGDLPRTAGPPAAPEGRRPQVQASPQPPRPSFGSIDGHVPASAIADLKRMHVEELKALAERHAKTLRTRVAAAEKAHQAQLTQLKWAHVEEIRSRDAAVRELRASLTRLTEAHRRKTAALEEKIAFIRRSASFRLGNLIVRSFKSPKALLRLPAEAWRLYRSVRAERQSHGRSAAGGSAAAPEIPRPGGGLPAPREPAQDFRAYAQPGTGPRRAEATPQAARPLPPTTPSPAATEDFVAAYHEGGVDRVIQDVDMAFPGQPGAAARELVKVGKLLSDRDEHEAEYPLAQAAIEREKSEPVLRGFFWAAQRAGKFEEARGAIAEIERLAGVHPSEAQVERLNRMKAGPANLISSLRLIQPRQARTIAPVPRRLCYVLHNSLPYASGGYATRSAGVAGGLKAAGYDVVVLTRPGFPLDPRGDIAPETVAPVEVLDGVTYVRTLAPQRRGISTLAYIEAAADALEARLKEYRPEIVIAASNYVVALPTLIAARRLGLPFIYEVRGLWEITRMSRQNELADKPAFEVHRLLEGEVAGRADHVWALTEALQEELVSRGVRPETVTVLPNSCDPSRFMPRPSDRILADRLGLPSGVPVIGYVGTMVDYEGLEDLAEACALLKAQGIEFRLLLVGNEDVSSQDRGPITAEIARIAESHGFSQWLVMPGRVPHEEVESYYSLIDIAPFPRKPWPVSEMVAPVKLLEALAMEKAVVVSSVRALVGMIEHEKRGLVFEKGNVEGLAETLKRLIDSPALRSELGARGRKWVEQERTWTQAGQTARNTIVSLGARPSVQAEGGGAAMPNPTAAAEAHEAGRAGMKLAAI